MRALTLGDASFLRLSFYIVSFRLSSTRFSLYAGRRRHFMEKSEERLGKASGGLAAKNFANFARQHLQGERLL